MSGEFTQPSWKDHQRAWLIKSAVELLSTVSINDLSVAQIARHAGVSRPLFYAYFDSKYDLLAAALATVREEADAEAEALVRVRADDGDVYAIVRSYVVETFDVWTRHQQLLAAMVQARDADPAIFALWDQMVQQRANGALKIAQRLRDEGSIRPITDDLPALMETLQGMANWALMDRARNQTRTSMERLIDVHTTVWLNALWGEAAPRPTGHKTE